MGLDFGSKISYYKEVTYRVELERTATSGLLKLPRDDQKRIGAKIDALKANPRPPGVTKLTGAEGWRVRVGNYRIVYLIDDAAQIVTVTRIAHRKDVYRRM